MLSCGRPLFSSIARSYFGNVVDALERFVLRRFLVILKALNLARGACVELRPLAWVCHEQFIKVWLVITKLGVYFSIQSSAL